MALAWIRSITNVQTAYVHLLLPSSTYPHTLSLFSLSHVSSTWHQPTAYFSPDCYQKKLTPFLMLAKLRILLSIKKRRKERKSALGVRCAYDAGVTFSKKILSTRTSATEMAPPTLPTFANARTACGWQGMPSHAPTKREYKASGRSQRSGWSLEGKGDKLQHPGICRCRVEDLNDASVTNVVQSPRVTSCSPRGGWEQNGHGVLCAYETPDVCVYRACRDLDGHVVRWGVSVLSTGLPAKCLVLGKVFFFSLSLFINCLAGNSDILGEIVTSHEHRILFVQCIQHGRSSDCEKYFPQSPNMQVMESCLLILPSVVTALITFRTVLTVAPCDLGS